MIGIQFGKELVLITISVTAFSITFWSAAHILPGLSAIKFDLHCNKRVTLWVNCMNHSRAAVSTYNVKFPSVTVCNIILQLFPVIYSLPSVDFRVRVFISFDLLAD